MNLIIEKDYKSLSKTAAGIVKDEIEIKPNLILGLATGSTPLGTYEELIRMHKEEGLDFSKVITFNLDEYLNLSPDNPQSYHYYMEENLFKHINVKRDNVNIPDGNARNIEEFCKDYSNKIEEAGGIDLQILGIGPNGHIAFNEPSDRLSLETHVVSLTKSTIEANSRFFDSIDEVPRKAVSMGMKDIMNAKKIILLANGRNKSQIMKEILTGNAVSTFIPASILLLHKDVTIILDEEAAYDYLKVEACK
jgi:glucosamine-6-phosphate deaminase